MVLEHHLPHTLELGGPVHTRWSVERTPQPLSCETQLANVTKTWPLFMSPRHERRQKGSVRLSSFLPYTMLSVQPLLPLLREEFHHLYSPSRSLSVTVSLCCPAHPCPLSRFSVSHTPNYQSFILSPLPTRAPGLKSPSSCFDSVTSGHAYTNPKIYESPFLHLIVPVPRPVGRPFLWNFPPSPVILGTISIPRVSTRQGQCLNSCAISNQISASRSKNPRAPSSPTL